MGKFSLQYKQGGPTYNAVKVNKHGGSTYEARYTPKIESFADVQKIVRVGMVKDFFDIGDELLTHYKSGSQRKNMTWVVLDNDRECQWADGSIHPGLWIGTKYLIYPPSIQFDSQEQEIATETNATEGLYYYGYQRYKITELNLASGDPIPYGDYQYVYHSIFNRVEIINNGYNRYSHSLVRQWLNGSGTNWWTSQHIGDSISDEMMDMVEEGFLSKLDSDFLAVVNPVKIQAAANTVTDNGAVDVMYDRFFLPSVEEVYGVPQNNNAEGPYFPYWKNITGLNSPSNGSSSDLNDARKIINENNPTAGPQISLLRSNYRGTPNYVWVMDRGYINYIYPASTTTALLVVGVIS